MAVTFVSSSVVNNGDTPSEPAGATTDDVFFAMLSVESNTVTFTPVAAWNLIHRTTAISPGVGPFQQAVYWFRRTGSAPSFDFGSSSEADTHVVVACMRGVVSSGDPHSTYSFASGDDTSYEFATLTPSVTDCYLLGLLNMLNWDTLNHQPGAPHFEGESLDQGGTGPLHIVYGIAGTTTTGIYPSTSATGTINASGNTGWGATLIAVAGSVVTPFMCTSSRQRARPAPFRPGIAR